MQACQVQNLTRADKNARHFLWELFNCFQLTLHREFCKSLATSANMNRHYLATYKFTRAIFCALTQGAYIQVYKRPALTNHWVRASALARYSAVPAPDQDMTYVVESEI